MKIKVKQDPNNVRSTHIAISKSKYNQVIDLHIIDTQWRISSISEKLHIIIAEAELCTPMAWWYAKAEPLMIYKTYADALGLDKKISRLSNEIFFGAGDRGRTDTVLLPRDFESRASANSTTPAKLWTYSITIFFALQAVLIIFITRIKLRLSGSGRKDTYR